MIELILTLCLDVDPGRCIEHRTAMPVASVWECAANVPLYAMRVDKASRPYRVRRWQCSYSTLAKRSA